MNIAQFSALAFIAVCGCASWLVAHRLTTAWPHNWRGLKFLAPSLLPTLIILALIVIWDVYSRIQHEGGPHEEFMISLLRLLYGFPFVVLNLLVWFAVARSGARTE